MEFKFEKALNMLPADRNVAGKSVNKICEEHNIDKQYATVRRKSMD